MAMFSNYFGNWNDIGQHNRSFIHGVVHFLIYYFSSSQQLVMLVVSFMNLILDSIIGNTFPLTTSIEDIPLNVYEESFNWSIFVHFPLAKLFCMNGFTWEFELISFLIFYMIYVSRSRGNILTISGYFGKAGWPLQQTYSIRFI
jgi:hypothetical protein